MRSVVFCRAGWRGRRASEGKMTPGALSHALIQERNHLRKSKRMKGLESFQSRRGPAEHRKVPLTDRHMVDRRRQPAFQQHQANRSEMGGHRERQMHRDAERAVDLPAWNLRIVGCGAYLRCVMRQPVAMNVCRLGRAGKAEQQSAQKSQNAQPSRVRGGIRSAFDSFRQRIAGQRCETPLSLV